MRFLRCYFYCHGNMVCSVGYVIYSDYYIYRLVGIAFSGLFGFRSLFKFLSSVLKSADFREVPFLFYSFDMLTLGLGIRGWGPHSLHCNICNFVLLVLFRFFLCCFMYRFFLIFFSVRY